jgi:asparagine synthase (glutamine-hydrolysing)
MTVAADRPQSVAALARTGIDEQSLTLQLLSPYGPPWPLTNERLWRGVDSLSMGHYLTIHPDGSSNAVRWWSPPEPELPLEQGAVALLQALAEAVDARSQPGATVSADLSGGMDSTSLCYLAGRRGVPLVTVHYEPLDFPNDDSVWAKQCQTELSDVCHLMVARNTAPEWYAESQRLVDDIEGPYPFDRSRPTVLHLARLVADTGSTRHLLGIGADELFHPSSRRPPRGESYECWLASTADQLTVPWASGEPIDWEVPPKLPPWTTSDAVQTVRRLLQAAAAEPAQPLSPIPAWHQIMRLTLMNGAIVRRMSRAASRFGVSFHAPYLDDRVLEAALAIHPSDRTRSNPAKPSLAAAMRGIAPDDLFHRKTKGTATHEGYACRRRWNELLELCDDSRLARMGIIDAAVLRAALHGAPEQARPPMPRDPTRACELWLCKLPAGT